jgi:hypothetical protein
VQTKNTTNFGQESQRFDTVMPCDTHNSLERIQKMAKPINFFSVIFLVFNAFFPSNLRTFVPYEDFRIYNYINTNGHAENIGYLPADSPGQRALHALLGRKKGKWRLSLVSPAPHFVLKQDNGFVYMDIHERFIEVEGLDKHGKPISQR